MAAYLQGPAFRIVLLAVLTAALLGGCESPSRSRSGTTGDATPSSRPSAAGPGATKDRSQSPPPNPTRPRLPETGGQPPAATQPAPTTSRPATQEAESDRIPDYITVVDRFDPHRKAVVQARIEGNDRLVIETVNASRLRIDRRELSLDKTRSTVLRLDGQGIEWTPTYDVVEFERSPNGTWTPVRKVRSEAPR